MNPAQFERQSARRSSADLEGALGGSHALTSTSLAQAAERPHHFLPSLNNEIDVRINPNDVC
jgi:hypothetical protein